MSIPQKAPSSLSALAKFFWILGIVGIDQLSKGAAIADLRGVPPKIYFGDLFRFEYAENPGAFLSLGASLSPDTRFWIFAVLVGIFLSGASFILFREKLDRVSAFSLSVIVGGGIGNLIDRASRPNHGVVDFMNMGLGMFRTGIFNIADMAIMLGVIILLVRSFIRRDGEV